MPGDLSDWQLEVWQLLWNAKTTADPNAPGKRYIDPKAQQLGDKLGARSSPAQVGHTYVVRSCIDGGHDILAAFTPIARDEAGFTIISRVVVRFDEGEGKPR